MVERASRHRVVVLVHGGGLQDGLEEAYAGARLVDLTAPRGAWPTAAALSPLDVLVDATGDPDGEVRRFRELFRLLRPGGRYEVPLAGRRLRRPRSPLQDFLQALDDEGGGLGLPKGERRSLTRAVDEVVAERRLLSVVRRGRTLAKMRDRAMTVALTADPSRGRLLAELPGVDFDAAVDLRLSDDRRPRKMREHYSAPRLHLREYRDVVCGPKSVVVQRGLVLPDTYRHHRARRLTHKALTDSGPGFVVPPFRDRRVEDLDGVFFHLDNEIRGFFGHALTEQVSRLWAWRRAKEAEPDLKVLVSLNRGRPVAGWEYDLMRAGGIDPADVVVAEGPVRVPRLVSATPMFSMPAYVHPRIVETWDEIGAALRAESRLTATPRRIFCSRSGDKRACTNRAEVEALFAGHGFEVVHPEAHPLADQAALFHGADVVAGFAGSGMFTVMFSDRPKHLIALRPDTYGPSNEYMIAAVRGHRMDLVTSRATTRPTGKGYSKAAFRSSFAVDLDQEGAWLRGVLEGLDA